jgi:hypothetical protein
MSQHVFTRGEVVEVIDDWNLFAGCFGIVKKVTDTALYLQFGVVRSTNNGFENGRDFISQMVCSANEVAPASPELNPLKSRPHRKGWYVVNLDL